jgi:hypothetical protein
MFMYYRPSQPDDHRHCNHCGQRLPTDATVCFRCGSQPPFPQFPQVSKEISSVYEPGVELCEIGWIRKTHGFNTTIVFEAQVTGPNGIYIVATAEPVPNKMESVPGGGFIPSPTNEAMEAVSDLVAEIIHSGWEPLAERGYFWWNYRFRRSTDPQSISSGSETRRIDRDPGK